MNNELILLSGADIPFIEATVTIHQPTIYEISLIGEECLFAGCELLRFSKDILNSEDKNKLMDYSDFNIFMSIMNDKSTSMSFSISCAKQVLELLFPFYNIIYESDTIVFVERDNKFSIAGAITTDNFPIFKDIISDIFCLRNVSSTQEYNAQGELAKKIAEKFKRRQQQLAALESAKHKQKKVAIFSRYISILTVGEHKDINSFMKYTVYQLFDEFRRFELKSSYDAIFKAKLAGAKDLKDPEDWMKDIHDN